MPISFNDALGSYEVALKLRSKRAEVLSSNLANADTPNYKARDFDFQKALAAQTQGLNPDRLQTSHAQHQREGGADDGVGQLLYRTPSQPSIDGNTVDENLEHAEYMANNLEFQTAFTLLNSRFKGLISAIKGE